MTAKMLWKRHRALEKAQKSEGLHLTQRRDWAKMAALVHVHLIDLLIDLGLTSWQFFHLKKQGLEINMRY